MEGWIFLINECNNYEENNLCFAVCVKDLMGRELISLVARNSNL
jgi:hypothetical protein